MEDKKAQQKFGNAKAISSDMFFQDRDPDAEMRSTLARYEGSSSISSADLFGGPQTPRQQYSGGSIQVNIFSHLDILSFYFACAWDKYIFW